MNNLIKKIITGFTVGLVILYTLPVYSFASTESVYSKLKSDGESYQTIVTIKDNDEVKQENSQKELPVETKVTYILDGEEISSEDLAGKSGKVTVKIEYINKSAKNVYVNGSYQTMYTPFVMVVGTLIDRKKCCVKVLSSEDEWFGVTYKEDKPVVVEKFKKFKEDGVYPEKLWN